MDEKGELYDRIDVLCAELHRKEDEILEIKEENRKLRGELLVALDKTHSLEKKLENSKDEERSLRNKLDLKEKAILRRERRLKTLVRKKEREFQKLLNLKPDEYKATIFEENSFHRKRIEILTFALHYVLEGSGFNLQEVLSISEICENTSDPLLLEVLNREKNSLKLPLGPRVSHERNG